MDDEISEERFDDISKKFKELGIEPISINYYNTKTKMMYIEAYPIDSEYKKFLIRGHRYRRHGKPKYIVVEMGKNDHDLSNTFWSNLKMRIAKTKMVDSFKSAVNKMFKNADKEYIRDILFNTPDGEIRWAIAANLFRGNMKNLLNGKISVDQFLNVLR